MGFSKNLYSDIDINFIPFEVLPLRYNTFVELMERNLAHSAILSFLRSIVKGDYHRAQSQFYLVAELPVLKRIVLGFSIL